MVNVAKLKTLFPLSLDEPGITPHLNRAIWDYKDIEFENELHELEVIGSKTIYYLAPLLWVDMQDRADEYSESLETFKDVDKFQKNWLDRANSALKNNNDVIEGEMSWQCI